MRKKSVFISHTIDEKEIALALKELMNSSFLGMIDIFVSSDYSSLSLGRKWLEVITNSLKNCAVEIVICSPNSIERPWINFEAGAGWVRDIPVIPLCHSGMEPADLPIPLNYLQAGKAIEELSLKEVFRIVAGVINSEIPNADFGVFIDKVKSFELRHNNPGNLISRLTGRPAPEPSLLELSDEAKQLLIEVSQDSDGKLLAIVNESVGDLIIQTNGKSLCNSSDPRIRASWKDAVTQLENKNFIKGESKTKYSITARGYQVVDVLKVLSSRSRDTGTGTEHEEEKAKEQIFKLVARKPLAKEAEESRWASIDVENISSTILEKCFVVLDDVLDVEGKSVLQIERKRRLLWSWGEGETSRDEEKDIVPGEPKVVDVATTYPNNQQITLETHGGQESKDKGIYETIITAHGRLNNQPKTETSQIHPGVCWRQCIDNHK